MKWLSLIFVVFCLFPYLDFFNLGTDTQPNALVIGCVILFAIKNIKVNKPIIILWSVFFISIFLYFYNQVPFYLYLKNTMNYLSPPLVATATYVIYNQLNFRVSFKWFFVAMGIYAFVGLVQLYFIPDFLVFLINEGRGTLIAGRGVVSLFAEPAFYGSTCLLFMAFSLLSYNKTQNIYTMAFLIFQLVFLSRSATAIAIFLSTIGIFTIIQILRFRLKYLLGTAVGLLLTSAILMNYWSRIESSRAGSLAHTFIENPLLVTQIDGSVGVRFTGTVAPFLSMRHHYFMPQGLGFYEEFLAEFRKKRMYKSFLTVQVEKKLRLSGGINMVLYQLGFIGILFPFAIYLAFRSRLRDDGILFAFLLTIITMMTQLQLMNAMIGFVIGTAIYQGKIKQKRRTDQVSVN